MRIIRWSLRWFFTLAVVANLIAWPLGNWWSFWYDRQYANPSIHIYSALGCCMYYLDTQPDVFPHVFGFNPGRLSFATAAPTPYSWLWLPRFDTFSGGLYALRLPFWFQAFLCAIPAGLLWRAEFRARLRRRVGHCSSCGYSRAGILAAAPCPECGTRAQGST